MSFSNGQPPCVTVVIPVFNEEATLDRVLDAVLAQPFVLEVIVVDDASTDRTRDVIRSRQVREPRLKSLFQQQNRGKGAALREGFRNATGAVVVVQDADLEYDPSEYGVLLKPIFDGKADVVFGSRFIGSEAHRVLYFWHSVGNKFLTLLSNAVTNLNLTDMETGSKAFLKSVLDRVDLQEDRFGFEPEITAKVARLGVRIYEVAVSYHGRTYAEGKKIGWKDGVQALWCIVKYGLLDRSSERVSNSASGSL